MEWSIDRLIDETQRLAARGLPRAEFFSELAPRLRNVIDNDASCWHTLDPHPRMLTSDAPDGLIDRGIYAPREAAAAGELIVRNPPLVSTDVLRGLPWRRCPGYGPFIVPELAEAAARTGDVAVLASAHRWVKKRTCVTPTDWSLGVEARIPALQSHGPDADAFYRQSVEHLRRTPRPDRTGAHSSALWRVAATPAPPSRCSRAGVCETRHRLAQGARHGAARGRHRSRPPRACRCGASGFRPAVGGEPEALLGCNIGLNPWSHRRPGPCTGLPTGAMSRVRK